MTLQPMLVPTKGEAAYVALRAAILDGRLRPGQRVTLVELAADLGMSLTPIREALRLLATQGLVEQSPHRATRVVEYSRSRADEISRLRLVLEPLAVEYAAAHADDAELAAVQGALDELDAAITEGRLGELPALNAVLHRRIYQAAGSPFLLEFIDRLWNGITFQAMSLVAHHERSAQEHHAIVEALTRRQGKRAARLVRAHIENATHDAVERLDRYTADAAQPLEGLDSDG